MDDELLRLLREETDRSEAATAAQQAVLAESREAAANLTTRIEEQASASLDLCPQSPRR